MEIKVSVIMPTYNNGRYIHKAIDSVLSQNVELELIIVDDASTDETERVLQKYMELDNIVYVKNEINCGVAESRNIGTSLAQGEYVAFLDADDWWEPQKLQKQLDALKQSKEVLCCTGRALYDDQGNSLGKYLGVKSKITYKELLYKNSIACSSVLMPIAIAREFPMCEDRYHEDYIMWLSILKKYDTVIGLNEPLLNTRLSEGGKSRNKIKSVKMTYGVFRYIGYSKITATLILLRYEANTLIKYVRKS